jgi:hypothetical protein
MTVWILLGVLVAVGLRQTAPRRIGASRALVLPAALVLMSISGAWRTFGAGGAIEPLVAWALGAGIGAAGTRALDLPRGVVAHADGSLEIPGSFAPLAIMLAIFLAHYVVHVALAIAPTLAAQDAFVVGAAAAYGIPSGMVAARARKLWTARAQWQAVHAA